MTGATATGIGAGGSLGRAVEARRSTAIFCMMVRTCGLTIFSRTPSPTDFRSARIMATPTRSPCGAHGQENSYTPVFETVLVARQRSVAREHFHGVEHDVVLVRAESALAQPQDIGLLVIQ